MTTEEQKNKAVSSIKYNDYDYQSTDVYTNDDGELCFWLPAGQTEITYQIGETTYSASGMIVANEENNFVAVENAAVDPAAMAAAKEAAESAFSAIPAYDGSNIEELITKVEIADGAIQAAKDVGWKRADIETWDNYGRYLSADAIRNNRPAFPTVTLTVMGRAESEDETECYFIKPTHYSVLAGSTVAEVVTAALKKEGVGYDSTGNPESGGGFFLKSVGEQANSGSLGWMYMVDSNAYIAYGMSDYVIQGDENILVYYSAKGFNGSQGDSDPEHSQNTPYGTYTDFPSLLAAADAQQTVVDLKSDNADDILEKDWTVIANRLSLVRTWMGDLPLPVVGSNGSIVLWSSANQEIVSNMGKVTLPPEVTTITLTATLYFSDKWITRTLDVKIGTSASLNVTVRIETADPNLNLSKWIKELGGNGEFVAILIEDLSAFQVSGLSYDGYGADTVMAVHALSKAHIEGAVPYLGISSGDTANAHIKNLLGFPVEGEISENGQRWIVRVINEVEETVFEEDYSNNLLLPLENGDTVIYRYIADTSSLQSAFELASSAIGATIYSQETYNPFEIACVAAKAVLEKDVFSLTQAEVDEAEAQLLAAYDALAFNSGYFGGGEDSIHNSVLTWITKYPAWLYRTQPNATGRAGFVALALNGKLTEDFVGEGMKSHDYVLWETLYNTVYPPTEEQVSCAVGLTIGGLDMTYFYTPSNLAGFEEWDYPLTFIMSGSTSTEAATGRIAGRLIVLNVLPYPDYQNLQDREQTTDLSREFLLKLLINGQMEDGRWEHEIGDGGQSVNAPTMYAMEALAPYYNKEIPLPDTVSWADLEAAVRKGLPHLTSDDMLNQFTSNEALFYSRDGYRLLNVLLMYGVDINDPNTVRFPCSGDKGIIDWMLKTYLSGDGTHFRRKEAEEFWLTQDNGDLTSDSFMTIVRLNGKLGLTMTLYKQFLDNGHATFYQNEPYQNQEEKTALELKVYHARMDTLALNREKYISEGNTTTIADYYENLPNYTAESGNALVEAIANAYNVLIHLDSTKEEILAAEAALDAALAGLEASTPEGVQEQIENLKPVEEITPEKTKATEVSAARKAFDALTEEQQAEVTNEDVLLDAEHWSAIAVDYNAVSNVGDYLESIGDSYAALGENVTDDWIVVDMVMAGRKDEILKNGEGEQNVQDFVTGSISSIDPATMTDYERVLLAVTALGVDGKDLTKYCEFYDKNSNLVTSLVDAIASFDGEIEVQSMIWGLVALDSGDYTTPADAKWSRDAMISKLLEFQLENGAWPIYANKNADVDTTAMAIVALAPYINQSKVKTAVDKAWEFLSNSELINSDGAFTTGPNVSSANANSTAMVILARIAAGENPAAGVKNPVSGLIADFGLSDFTGFGYSAKTPSNAMATEQSFRALAAYKALAYDHNAKLYYFGTPTLDGEWQSSATSITLKKTEITLTVDGTEQLEATVTPEGQEIIWTSSDTDVATVSEDGLVTAVKAGTATITAKLNDGKKATCTVTVLEISLDKTELTLIEGDAEQLTATVSPEGAAVIWSSSDSDVATVSESGLVTAVKAGTATITAKVNDETTATCAVTVQEKTTTLISLDKTEITLTVGNTEQLTATVNPETETVTWSSSDPEVATVSEDGLVTAVKAGTATITAKLNDDTEATCAVTVKEETSISLNKTETTLTVGETEQLEATVNPETETVTWTSSDTEVATVSAAGLVTAVKAGTATITAALAGGKTAACAVTVQKDPTKITISFTLLGDTVHGSNGHVHTLKSGNESLTTWIDTAYVTVPADSTVWDLLEQVLTDNGYTWDNPTKNYVISITTPKGVTLEQKDNGSRSGWMYTLNGVHPNLGVNEQTLADGDTVVFHYTDDMTKETDVGGELVVDSLSLNKEKLELDSGASEKLIATADPLGAPVTWSSSDTAVAKVNEDGKVTAVAAGSAVITASSGDKTAQCTVIVDGYDLVEALKAEIAALPDNVTAANKDAVNTAKAHYDALTAAQKKLLTTEETAKLMKAVNTLQVLNDLDGLAETKDFTSTEANTKNAVTAALGEWLNNSSAKVSVTAFTAAVDGTAEKPEGKAGSYSATITLSVGTGDAATSGSKTVTGSITPKAYAPGSEAGVKSIKVSGDAAKGSGTSYSAVLPYGADLSALTAKSFTITLKDTNAKVSAAPATADGGKTWTFTVTAEDGETTKEYTVTLSVSDVKVTLLDSAIYSVTDDVEVTSLSPAAVEGLLEAVSIDDLKLPEGTKAIGLWLKVTAVKKDGKDITVKLEPVYSYDGSEETAVPASAIISEFTVTLPIEGTEYARVLYGGNYLAAKVYEDGISFVVEVPGEYTVIPDARLVTVTFHLCGGSSDDVADGEMIVYYRENAGDDLPQKVVKDDNRFEGWFDTEDGTGKVFATVSADLPDELYAVWSSDVKIQEVGDIGDEVTVTTTVENDVATITVTADEPCVVIVKNGDTYERMEAIKNEDGSYSFVQEDYDVNMVFYVAVLGDYDGDGDLDKADLSAANKAIMSNKTIDPLKVMIMGAEGKKLKTVDLAKLCLAIANKKVEW